MMTHSHEKDIQSPSGRRRPHSQMMSFLALLPTAGGAAAVTEQRSESPRPRRQASVSNETAAAAASTTTTRNERSWARQRGGFVRQSEWRFFGGLPRRRRRFTLLWPGGTAAAVLVCVLLRLTLIQHTAVFITTDQQRILDSPVDHYDLLHYVTTTTVPLMNANKTNSSSHSKRKSRSYVPNPLDDGILKRNDTHTRKQQTILQQDRKLVRQQRTRPPLQQSLKTIRIEATTPLRIHGANATMIHLASPPLPPNWKELCRAAGLSNDSHVLITNALTAYIGPPLVMLLNKQCGVHRITIVDPMFPNLRSVRSNAMKVYRLLLRSISHVQLVVPSIGWSRQRDGLQWLNRMNSITHIIHMESADAMALYHSLLNPYMSQRSQRANHWQASIVSLQHLLLFVTTRTTSMTLLHVMESVPLTQSSDENDASPWRTRVLKQSHDVLSATWYTLTDGRVALHRLELPPLLTGSNLVVPTTETFATKSKNAAAAVHVEDAIAGILTALQQGQRTGLHRMTIAPFTPPQHNNKNNSSSVPVDAVATQNHLTHQQQRRQLQTKAVNLALQYPFGVDTRRRQQQQTPVRYPHGVHHAINQLHETFGIHQSRFPCSSSCTSPTSPICEVSAFDDVIQFSVAASTKCQYVVYLVDFAPDAATVFKPGETGGDLCRIAFVAGNSPLVQRALDKATKTVVHNIPKEEALRRFNGKLKENGWTLVWLANDDDSTLSDADAVIPIMEPSRLFALSVVKAMYTSSPSFAEPSDVALLRILERMDRPPLPKHARREHRPGITLSRFVPQPAEHGRTVLLFASETPTVYQPQNIPAFARLARTENVTIPRSQVKYYTQLSRWIQSDYKRPDDDSPPNSYQTVFPFQWISLGLIIHDLRYDAAHMLRCSWLDEYLFWGTNRGAEELSLAYILGMQRSDRRIAPGLAEDPTWMPLWNDRGQRVTTEAGSEAFVRTMTTKSMAPSNNHK